MASISNTITQSPLFGGNQGDAFDDVVSVAGWPTTQNIHKISKIVVRHGEIIDNVTVTYELVGSSSPSTQEHGGPGGNETTITLSDHEYLVGVSGQYGPVTPDFGSTNIQKLQLVILDKVKGSVRLEPPTGSFADGARKPGIPFFITGTVLALAGYSEVATSTRWGTRRYLQSLSFFNASTGFD